MEFAINKKMKRRTINIFKTATYFVLHVPATLIFMSVYLEYSYFSLHISDDMNENRRISEIILVLSLLLVIVRMVMTAKKRRWHYIIINSMAPFVFYNTLVFAFYAPRIIIALSVVALVLSVFALVVLFEKKNGVIKNFRKKLRTAPIVVTNIIIIVLGVTTIWPLFQDVINIGYVSASYESEQTAEDEKYENIKALFQGDIGSSVEEKLKITAYITETESEYYGVIEKPAVSAAVMDTAVLASTNFEDNEITYNKAYLAEIDKETLLSATLHEMAHVYQNNLIIMYITQIQGGDFEDMLVFNEARQIIDNSGSYVSPREDYVEYKSQFAEEHAEEKAKERYEVYREIIGEDYLGEYPD